MKIFPAIDLHGGRAVRLLRGDYAQMTVYSDNPPELAARFAADGAEYLHVVDLEGARDGTTANFETVRRIISGSGLKTQIGGGVRTEDVVERYLGAGAMRVILGTAAITQPGFVADMARKYGERIAVGVDIRDGMVAIKGWMEISARGCFEFMQELEAAGVRTVICTDISKDGAMQGTNLDLYSELSGRTRMDIVASGGVSSIDDVKRLAEMGTYGAILGKALYTGAVELRDALAAGRSIK